MKGLLSTALLVAVIALCSCGSAAKSTVANVKGKDPAFAYRVLHRAGLRVSIRRPLAFVHFLSLFRSDYYREYAQMWQFAEAWPGPAATVTAQTTRGGSVVARGSVVALSVSGVAGDSGVFRCESWPTTASRLTGLTLRQAVLAAGKCVGLAAKLPPLHRAGKPNLLDNYEVVAQRPAAGAWFLPPTSASNPPPRVIALRVRATG